MSRFVFVRMNPVQESSSRPGWWHGVRKAAKPMNVNDVLVRFLYGMAREVETTDDIAQAVLTWAATIPGWNNQLVVETWENGRKVS